MINERKMATEMLNAVWDEDLDRLEDLLSYGADPNWYFNGYPIILHAVYTRNPKMVLLLLQYGSIHGEEALGFALEKGIGEVVAPLAYLGIIPKSFRRNEQYGPTPARYCPMYVPKYFARG